MLENITLERTFKKETISLDRRAVYSANTFSSAVCFRRNKSSDIKKLKHIFTILSFRLIGASGVLLIFFAFFQTDSTENYTISVMRNEFIIPEILDNKTAIKEKKTTEWRIQHQYATLTISPTEINALLAHNSPMKSCSSSDCKMLNWYKIRPTSGNYFSEENVGTENIVCAKKI